MTEIKPIEGIACLCLGSILLFSARMLARVPRRSGQWFRGRHPGIARFHCVRLMIFESDRAVLVLTYFWRFCGTVWIVSGIELIFGWV